MRVQFESNSSRKLHEVARAARGQLLAEIEELDFFGFVLVFAPVRLALSSGQRPATDDPGRTQYAAFERYGTASRAIL